MNKKLYNFNKSNLEQQLLIDFPQLNKDDISKAIDVITHSIIEAVALENKVEIRGFGTFSKKHIRPRKFVNPKTKQVSYLGETSTIHFKASKSLIQD